MRGSPRRSRSFRAACRILWVLVVASGIGALYLAVVGFPDAVTERVRRAFSDHGYDVRIERIRFNPLDGLVAERFRVFLDDEDRHPAVEASAVVLGLDPLSWWRGEHGLRRVRVRDGVFRMNTEGPLVEPEGARVLLLEAFQADMRFEEGGVRITRVRAELNTMKINGRGFVLRDPERTPHDEPVTPVLLRDFMESQAGWLSPLVEEINAIDFKEPPHVQFDFQVRHTEPVTYELTVLMEGGGTRFRGLFFDGWEIEVHLDDQHLRIPVCEVFHEARRFTGQASFDLERQEAEARMYINLLPVYWRNLMPPLLREYMERARIHAFGPTEAELTFEKAPWTEFGQHIEGWFMAEQVEAHGVWVQSIRADLLRQRERIRLENMVAEIGRDDKQGPAWAEAEYNLEEGVYHGHVRASFDPHAVLPVAGYSATAAEIIQSIAFNGELPTMEVTFSGTIPPDATFNFTGDIRGSDFLYRGSFITMFDSTFLLTNRVLRLDPLRVEREEGRLDGWYEQDFDRRITELDIVSGVDPKALARVGGGTVEQILRPFRFEGPVELHVQGLLDYGAHLETDYTAVGKAELVGWRWITADTCSMEWIAQGDRITMTNLQMDVYGGRLEGDVQLEGIGSEPVRYTARAQVADVGFATLLREVRQAEMELQEGSLSGRIEVEGLAEDDWRASLEGEGRVRIREGQVFQIPLLGGLSQLLGRIYPRLGFAVQTDARAHFDIRERHISSDNIRIEGALLSLRGEGQYQLDDNLDFKVQVLPLRRGFLVDAVRLVTYPVSRLLQFRLKGTLSEPHWSIDSLPRELWSLFEREE